MEVTVRWRARAVWMVTGVLAIAAGLLLAVPQRGAGSEAVQGPPRAIPVFYMKNVGQVEAATRFLVQTPEVAASLETGKIVFHRKGHLITLEFPGANAGAMPEGHQPMEGTANFLLGKDSSTWVRNVPLYKEVRYRDLYPGIDMVYGANGRSLKSDFIVAPGADPKQIHMRYWGIDKLSIAEDGSLVVLAPGGELRELPPELYQVTGGSRMAIPGRFELRPGGEIGFEVGAYDRSRPLWIDPVISYSTYAGGSRTENATAAAVDSSGNLYLAGWTESVDHPTASPVRSFAGSVDAFVMKFNSLGTGLLYATFLGGSSDDRAYGMDIDPSGNAYVVGYTTSNDFPVVSAVQTVRRGGRDAFVTKLNAAGSAIAYSTYFGGSGNDTANGVAVDQFGQPYVVGETDSTNFTLRFPYQSAKSGLRDAFSFKLNMSGALSYSTYIGGNGDDRGVGIAISASLTPYIVGCTTSTNFPTRNPAQASNGGGMDGFVVRFNGDANALVYSTYIGGNGGSSTTPECAQAIAVDAFNNSYVTGVTASTNLPLLLAFQTAPGGGGRDAFVAKYDVGGVRQYTSYLGGRGIDIGTAIRVDSARRAHVGGYTASNNFPVINGVQSTFGGVYDAFFVRVDVSGASLNMSSYVGGSGTDVPLGIAYQSTGDLYMVGLTNSINFPLQSPLQPNLSAGIDSFVTKIGGAGQ